MRDAMTVLLSPVVSEKSYALMDQGVYTFEIDEHATKVEVAKAVETAFHVKVVRVNTLRRSGKATRNRRTGTVGRRPSTKRALVTLRAGDKIDLFET